MNVTIITSIMYEASGDAAGSFETIMTANPRVATNNDDIRAMETHAASLNKPGSIRDLCAW
jgi:hypothetical protein